MLIYFYGTVFTNTAQLNWEIEIQIDKEKKDSIYLQIADEIIRIIKNGILKQSTILPGTPVLVESLRVNKNTVIQAMDIWIVKGWLSNIERKKAYND